MGRNVYCGVWFNNAKDYAKNCEKIKNLENFYKEDKKVQIKYIVEYVLVHFIVDGVEYHMYNNGRYKYNFDTRVKHIYASQMRFCKIIEDLRNGKKLDSRGRLIAPTL